MIEEEPMEGFKEDVGQGRSQSPSSSEQNQPAVEHFHILLDIDSSRLTSNADDPTGFIIEEIGSDEVDSDRSSNSEAVTPVYIIDDQDDIEQKVDKSHIFEDFSRNSHNESK